MLSKKAKTVLVLRMISVIYVPVGMHVNAYTKYS
jgi:hypothetical protein